MQQNEQLITQWAPALLNMQLGNLLWWDRNDINVGELWKLLCTYCYLPRLASFEVLQTAIRSGVNTPMTILLTRTVLQMANTLP